VDDGLHLRPCTPADHAACLALFDANCPENFAPGERDDFAHYLASVSGEYRVVLLDDRVVGAFGLHVAEPGRAVLHWILFSPAVQGRGLGSAVMSRVLDEMKAGAVRTLQIGASHRSAPFFARFGAVATRTTPDGWGPGMHRVDMVLEP